MNKAFTLAEVLITLAIIGVVAAMTVPNLMTSTRGKEYEVGANKALSTIANAMQMRYAMDGTTLWDFPKTTASENLGAKAVRYLFEPPGGTNARVGEKPALQGKYLKTVKNGGGAGALSGINLNVYELKDGMIVHIFDYSKVGITCLDSVKTDLNSGIGNVYMVIDTNGKKGPTRSPIDGFNYACIDGVCWTSGATPSKNTAPDMVAICVSPVDSAITGNQRTRNILATGNAMISK